MNSIDNLILLVLLFSLTLGLYWGFIRQVLAIIGLIAGIVLASRYGPDVADALSSFIRSSMVAQAVGFVVVLVAVSSLASLLATLLHRFVGLLFLGWLDHLAGGLLGLLQAGLVCTVLLAVAASIPDEWWRTMLSSSRIAPLLIRAFGVVLQLLPESFRFTTQLLFGRV